MTPFVGYDIGTGRQRTPAGSPTPDHDTTAVPISVVIAIAAVIDNGEHRGAVVVIAVAIKMVHHPIVNKAGIHMTVDCR